MKNNPRWRPLKNEYSAKPVLTRKCPVGIYAARQARKYPSAERIKAGVLGVR